MTFAQQPEEEIVQVAALAAIQAYLQAESPETPISSQRQWRNALRRGLRQPNLWRNLAWVQTTELRHR